MLPFVGKQLTTRVKHIVTIGPDAVDMIVSAGEFTAEEPAWFMFHKLLEPIFVELLIFHVVILVLLCYNKNTF